MRYKCKCEYDGFSYCGWQRQSEFVENKYAISKRSIQRTIENSLKKLYNGRNISIQGSSRTDAGVHAVCQVFHYDTDIEIPLEKIKYALNKILPEDIRVSEIAIVDDKFHSRYNTKYKSYTYSINTGEYNVFKSKYMYQYCKEIDLNLIQKSFKIFMQKRDFKALMASGSDKINTVREIYSINYDCVDNKIVFKITADGFLYHMVRIMIGSFIRLNEGQISVDDIEEALKFGHRDVFRYTAPPNGLCLSEVVYEEDYEPNTD